MKRNLTAILIIGAFNLLAACSKAPESTNPTAEKTTTSPAVAVPDPNLPEKKVEITGNDQMKYDVTAIEAKAGQRVTVTLKNAGIIPKISMGHNFVLLTPGTDPTKFVEAGTPYMGKEYIAPEMQDKVIAHTKLLGPGETDTISFAAPRRPGIYTYICSFPGHFAIGMKGTLTVQ